MLFDTQIEDGELRQIIFTVPWRTFVLGEAHRPDTQEDQRQMIPRSQYSMETMRIDVYFLNNPIFKPSYMY